MIRYLSPVVMLLALSAGAQTYKPSCAQTLALSASTFTSLYVALNHNESEAGYDQAAGYWAGCKRQDNLRRLQNYPSLKARLEQLRKLYLDLRRAETEIALEYYGGGTLYSHTLSRSVTGLEEHLSDLISLTTRSLGRAEGDRFSGSYDYALSQVEGYIKSLRGFSDKQIELSTRSRWNAAIARYEAAYRGILKVAGTRKDATSATILGFVNSPLWIQEILHENQ